MILDCVVIGGGPAGLNAALMLGRAKRKVMVFDDERPRNAVTHESHGFITRDGIDPREFRAIGQQEMRKYPSVEQQPLRIETVTKKDTTFELVAANSERFEARTVLLATGFQEILPAIEGIYDYYGKSLFNCPYCEGWELRDQPLVVIVEDERFGLHMVHLLYNWSHDIVVCTNGHRILSEKQKDFLQKYAIQLHEEKIVALRGENGQLRQVVFENQKEIECTGGLVATPWKQATTIAEDLGCTMNAFAGIEIDSGGRTNIPGIYAAGDCAVIMPSQMVLAAASGSNTAMNVINDLIVSDFPE
jgi:thioredoxin reductase